MHFETAICGKSSKNAIKMRENAFLGTKKPRCRGSRGLLDDEESSKVKIKQRHIMSNWALTTGLGGVLKIRHVAESRVTNKVPP